MGADMVLAGFAVSKTWNMDNKTVREQRKQAMLAEVDTLRLEDLSDFSNQFREAQPLSELKKQAKEVIEETMNSLDNNREVATWNWKDVTFYFTGGMTWGDDPTDTYTCFERFQTLPDKVTRHLL